MSPIRRTFADKDELALALADAVVGNLNAGIAARGRAAFAVSGGSTPARFFKALSQRTDVDWTKVTVALVDERWVDESSDRSNARLVKANLLQGPAAAAAFVPLWQGGDVPDEAGIARANAAIAAIPVLDAVILGMGNDGHTASFFPGGDTLEEALTIDGPVIAIRAPGAGEPRITLTLRRVLAADALYLHIEGNEKAEVLDQALGEGDVADMPVRAVLRQEQKPVTVFWCP
ncbi:MAG: 6-phosphogluconolactonase [Hyphomicrobiales bacterium]|nr:MAG: 6-phosphogluconolactonase [Hyphomicrobiales bacterium]